MKPIRVVMLGAAIIVSAAYLTIFIAQFLRLKLQMTLIESAMPTLHFGQFVFFLAFVFWVRDRNVDGAN